MVANTGGGADANVQSASDGAAERPAASVTRASEVGAHSTSGGECPASAAPASLELVRMWVESGGERAPVAALLDPSASQPEAPTDASLRRLHAATSGHGQARMSGTDATAAAPAPGTRRPSGASGLRSVPPIQISSGPEGADSGGDGVQDRAADGRDVLPRGGLRRKGSLYRSVQSPRVAARGSGERALPHKELASLAVDAVPATAIPGDAAVKPRGSGGVPKGSSDGDDKGATSNGEGPKEGMRGTVVTEALDESPGSPASDVQRRGGSGAAAGVPASGAASGSVGKRSPSGSIAGESAAGGSVVGDLRQGGGKGWNMGDDDDIAADLLDCETAEVSHVMELGVLRAPVTGYGIAWHERLIWHADAGIKSQQ